MLAKTEKIDVTAATALYRRARELALAEFERLPVADQWLPDAFERLVEKHALRLQREENN